MPKITQIFLRDFFDQSRLGNLSRLEDYVPALHVCFHIAKPKRLKRRAQPVHFDGLVSADVDAAEHGDVDGHDCSGVKI